MTATAPLTVPPRRSTAGRPHGLTGPRLLLPPLAEPRPRQEHLVTALAALPALCPVRSVVTEAVWGHAPAEQPPRGPRAPELPDPAAVSGAVVLAAVEVLSGVRPAAQLGRWLSPELYERLAGLAAGTGAGGAPVGRVTILRSRVCRVTSTVAEASVVVHDGRRVRAAAVRLEVHRGRWRATVLQIG